jgi:hypothetical protein
MICKRFGQHDDDLASYGPRVATTSGLGRHPDQKTFSMDGG